MNNIRNIVPVNRNNIFSDDEEFGVELDFMSEYMSDLNQEVILYRVDRKRTNINDVYKEAKKDTIRYLPPIALPCIYEISDAQLDSYVGKTSVGSYQISGSLKFHVLMKTLQEYDCDISRGDYVAIQIDENKMAYFTVVDDGKVNTSNRLVTNAFKRAWREVLCSPSHEFNGI